MEIMAHHSSLNILYHCFIILG